MRAAKKKAAKPKPGAKPVKLKCTGKTQKGEPCTRFAAKDRKTCNQHSLGYVRDTTKTERDNKSIEVMKKLEQKVKHREKLGKYKIKEEPKIVGDPLSEFSVNTWLDIYIKHTVKKITASDRENNPMLIDFTDSIYGSNSRTGNNKNNIIEPVKFPRRFWQKIGWELEKDRKSYANLALTCRELYRLLCEDKIWGYYHPLRSKTMHDGGLIHPMLLMAPFYRLVQFEVPSESETALKENNLPTFEELLEFTKDEIKDMTQKEFMQRCGDIMQELMQALLTTLVGKSKYIPSIEGGGIFEDIRSKVDVRPYNVDVDFSKITNNITLDFISKPPDFKIVKKDNITWIVIKSFNVTQDRIMHEEIKTSLVGFDGLRLTRLMKY